VAAGRGFNCFEWKVPLGGRTLDLLWTAPDFITGGGRASHSGIPLLFPWPGRLRGKSLLFGGRTYDLSRAPDDGRGNAIHGFALNRPWRVIERSEAIVTGEFQASKDAPEVAGDWPSDYRLRCRYELVRGGLECQFEVHNAGTGMLPWGFGAHPYFRVPVSPNGKADACVVRAPVREIWELKEMLPSGKCIAAKGDKGLAEGCKFGEMRFDDVFTGLVGGPKFEASIEDRAGGARLVVEFEEPFRECVVYNPPHREAVCIEPYSCAPDAYSLAEQGIETGLVVLEPGASRTLKFRMRVQAI
jgi:aldose 1-epimerase